MITSTQIHELTHVEHKETMRHIRTAISDLDMVLQSPTANSPQEQLIGGNSPPISAYKSESTIATVSTTETYANEGCVATKSEYVDKRGLTQPQYELSDEFAMNLMADYGKESRRAVLKYLAQQLETANKRAEIHAKAFDELYCEAQRVADDVCSVKCDISGANAYEERQRTIKELGGPKKVNIKKTMALVALEDQTAATATRLFTARKTKHLAAFESILQGTKMLAHA